MNALVCLPDRPAPPRTAGMRGPGPITVLRRLDRYRAELLLVCLAALPLLWPALPPLVDLPNHLSRYRIALDYSASPLFRTWFELRHPLIGNLGVDLLVAGLAPGLGLEPAAKLVVLAIPVGCALGIVLIAREVHGRVAATTPLAVALVYNYPFNYGFLNYSLSMAMALPAFWLWLRLGRLGRGRLSAALFVPIGGAVWLAHASGWGLLGLMVFAWELASARAEGRGWPAAAWRGLLGCLPLAAPALPMLLWSAHTHSVAVPPPDPIGRKVTVFFMMLSTAWRPADIAAAFALLVVALLPIVRPELRYDRRLLAVGLTMMAAFLLMPPNIIGSAHADMRVVPYAMMILLLGLVPRGPTRFARGLALFSWAFFATGVGYNLLNDLRIARVQSHQLEALDHLPRGTSVFALAKVRCGGEVTGDRVNHLHRMAIVRRGDVTNGSWGYPATQTVLPRPAMVSGYVDDGSALMEPRDCLDRAAHTIPTALAILPRDRFRYLWVVDMPPAEWPARPWLHRFWSNNRGALYRIDPPAEGPPAQPATAIRSREVRRARPDARAIATHENW